MWHVLHKSGSTKLLYLCGEQVEVLSAIVSSVASAVKAAAVIDVGAGQVYIPLFNTLLPQVFPFILSI